MTVASIIHNWSLTLIQDLPKPVFLPVSQLTHQQRRPLSAQNRFFLASEMKQNDLRKDSLLYLFSCRSCIGLLDTAVNRDLFLANMLPFDIIDREMK